MEEIILNESYILWLNNLGMSGVVLPLEFKLASIVSWFEYVGIFIIPQRSINGWCCKIEDIGFVQLNNFNTFPVKKERSDAIILAIEIASGLLR